MITRQDLEAYREHEQEFEQQLVKLKQYQKQIKRLEVSYGRIGDGIPAYEEIKKCMDELVKQILDNIEVIYQRSADIVGLINSIPNARIKAVMYQYYIIGDSWDDTAATLDMSLRTVRRLHGYGLESIRRIQETR